MECELIASIKFVREMCLLRTSEVRALPLVLLGLVVVDASDRPCGQGEAVVRKGLKGLHLSLRKAGRSLSTPIMPRLEPFGLMMLSGFDYRIYEELAC